MQRSSVLLAHRNMVCPFTISFPEYLLNNARNTEYFFSYSVKEYLVVVIYCTVYNIHGSATEPELPNMTKEWIQD